MTLHPATTQQHQELTGPPNGHPMVLLDAGKSQVGSTKGSLWIGLLTSPGCLIRFGSLYFWGHINTWTSVGTRRPSGGTWVIGVVLPFCVRRFVASLKMRGSKVPQQKVVSSRLLSLGPPADWCVIHRSVLSGTKILERNLDVHQTRVCVQRRHLWDLTEEFCSTDT